MTSYIVPRQRRQVDSNHIALSFQHGWQAGLIHQAPFPVQFPNNLSRTHRHRTHGMNWTLVLRDTLQSLRTCFPSTPCYHHTRWSTRTESHSPCSLRAPITTTSPCTHVPAHHHCRGLLAPSCLPPTPWLWPPISRSLSLAHSLSSAQLMSAQSLTHQPMHLLCTEDFQKGSSMGETSPDSSCLPRGEWERLTQASAITRWKTLLGKVIPKEPF